MKTDVMFLPVLFINPLSVKKRITVFFYHYEFRGRGVYTYVFLLFYKKKVDITTGITVNLTWFFLIIIGVS